MKKDNGSRDSLEEIFSKDDKFPKGMIGIFKTAEINLLSTFDKLAPTKAYLVSDPLSLNTKKEKRNLVISTSLLVVSYTYGIKDSAIPFLKNQDLNNSIVIGLLSLITLYLLITYILSYSHDVFALYQTKNCLVYESFRYPMEYSGEALIRASKAESTDKEKAHVEQVITILDSCRTAYRKVLLATAGSYLNKFFGTFLWDLVLPCGLSFFILSKANSEMWAVVNSIISKVF